MTTNTSSTSGTSTTPSLADQLKADMEALQTEINALQTALANKTTEADAWEAIAGAIIMTSTGTPQEVATAKATLQEQICTLYNIDPTANYWGLATPATASTTVTPTTSGAVK